MVEKTAHNITGKIKYSIRRAQDKRFAKTAQPALPQRAAFLGDNTGVLFSYNGATLPAGYVVVRDMDGNLSVAFNQRVTNVANTPINVGYDPLAPTLFQVLSTRDYLDQQPITSVPSHHENHEWPNADVVNVHGEQMLPALARGNNGMLVSIFPTFYPKSTGGWGFFGANADGTIQTKDMTASRPATGAQAFLISIKDDGTIAVTSGTTQASPELITAADFPTVPDSTYHPVCAVRLYSGQVTINQGQTGVSNTPDIYDLRWLSFGTGSGGGSAPVAGWMIKVSGSTVSLNPAALFYDFI